MLESQFPKVTIGIPTYNQAELLQECIESVVNQDYPNLEIIVLDDSSVDNSAQICRKFVQKYKHFHYFSNPQNLGRVATYHKLLYQLATGDWYLNLDGDDILLHQAAISNLIEPIIKDQKIRLAMGSGIAFSNKNELKQVNFDATEAKIYEGKEYFLKHSYKAAFNHAACLYHRVTAIQNDFYTVNSLNTDFISIIQLCFFGKIAISEAKTSGWRTHQNNATHQVSNAKNSAEIQAHHSLAKKAQKYFGEQQSKIWLEAMLENSEKYRIRYLIDNQGFVKTFYSLFSTQQRLTKKLRWSNCLRFFIYIIKK